MAIEISEDEFESAVDAAIDLVPAELLGQIDNCVVIIEDRSDDEDLFGYYDGIPLTERGNDYTGVLPDRIVIFRTPHLEAADSMEDLIAEITTTVVHEIAHFFGIDDDHLDEWGYA